MLAEQTRCKPRMSKEKALQVLLRPKGFKKMISIKIKSEGDLGYLYAGSIELGELTSWGRGRGRSGKRSRREKSCTQQGQTPEEARGNLSRG